MVIYLKSHNRRPVWIGAPWAQQEIPVAWCLRCGREIYRPDTELCDRCLPSQTDEKENEDV